MASTSSSTSNEEKDTLIFAHVLFRHGARNIVAPYPTDPFKDESHWPEGFGQLTNEGKAFSLRIFSMLMLGAVLWLLISENVRLLSTQKYRTIMSAQACLAGLYRPSEEDKLDEDINWQPIPVHTIPTHLDHVLVTGKNARDFNVLTLPTWAERALRPDSPMNYIANLYFQSYAATPELARLKQGFLIKEIMERFSKKIHSTLKPDRKLWLYSAHDLTIINVLNSLGLFEPHFPPYGASLHFELFRTSKGEHYFKIFYRKAEEEYPDPISIPGCGESCTLKQFYDLYSQIIPGDFERECWLPA